MFNRGLQLTRSFYVYVATHNYYVKNLAEVFYNTLYLCILYAVACSKLLGSCCHSFADCYARYSSMQLSLPHFSLKRGPFMRLLERYYKSWLHDGP